MRNVSSFWVLGEGFRGFKGFRRFRGCGIALSGDEYIISLREIENHTTALRARGKHANRAFGAKEMHSPFGGWCHHLPPASGGTTTRAYFRATYEWNAIRSFIVPPHSGVAKELDL